MTIIWIIGCTAIILTIFRVKLVSENDDKFLITVVTVILSINFVSLIQEIYNLDKNKDYQIEKPKSEITKLENKLKLLNGSK